MARERRVETRFARLSTVGKGIGIEDAVAAAEARIEDMREGVQARIGEMLAAMQAARPAVAAGDVEAMRFIHSQADALVGLSELFGLPEVGKAAFSLCDLFDVCRPGLPAPDGVCVHLDALQMFLSASPEVRTLAAPKVLEGLRHVALAARAAK